jgi:hypothetical protein
MTAMMSMIEWVCFMVGDVRDNVRLCNVGGKRAAQASERRTPPNLRTSTDVYLNNTTK